MAETANPFLTQTLRVILHSSGKRLRPALTLLAARLHETALSRRVELAAAAELLHTATLIHDDVIDVSDARRGRPTINASFNNTLAVLTGDYLFGKSGELVSGLGSTAIMGVYSWAVMELVQGEMLRPALNGDLQATERDYLAKIRGKTASLFAMCTQTGAMLDADDPPAVERLREYGLNLGMAFQVVDDVLDYTASEAELGKPVGSDLRHGTVTLPAIYYLRQYPQDARVRGLLDQEDSYQAEADAAVEAIRRSDAIGQALGRAESYAPPPPPAWTGCPRARSSKPCTAWPTTSSTAPSDHPHGAGEGPLRAVDVRRHRPPLRRHEPPHDGGPRRSWRRLAADAVWPETVRLALDVGAGTGDLSFALARAAPQAHVLALDFAPQMLQLEAAKGHRLGLAARVQPLLGDAQAVPLGEQAVDAVLTAFTLRNVPDIDVVLAECHRVLRPGGRLAVLELTPVRTPLFGPLFRFYFHRLVPLLGGLVSGRGDAYRYLPRSVERFPDADSLRAMLLGAGFARVDFRKLAGGTVALHVATRAPALPAAARPRGRGRGWSAGGATPAECPRSPGVGAQPPHREDDYPVLT